MEYHTPIAASTDTQATSLDGDPRTSLQKLYDAIVKRLTTEQHRLSLLRSGDHCGRAACERRLDHLEAQRRALLPDLAREAGQVVLLLPVQPHVGRL